MKQLIGGNVIGIEQYENVGKVVIAA